MLPHPPMARINYPPPSPDATALLDRLPPLNIFRMLSWSPPALDGFVRMGTALLYKGQLDAVLRELAIVRVGHLCGSDYEVRQHEHSLRELGVDADAIEAVARGEWVGKLPAGACEALALAEQMVAGRATGQALEAVRAALGEGAAVELTVVIGYYLMVSRVLTTLDVDIEDEDAFLKV